MANEKSNENKKKYASLSTLQTFLENLKTLFASKTELSTEIAKKADESHSHDDLYYTETEIDTKLSSKANSSHTHSISDTTDLQSTLDNKVPTSRTINSKSLTENITLSASDVGAAPSAHNHNDKYYQKSEVDSALSGKSDTTHNHDSDYADIDHNHDGVYAVEGHNHDTKYDSKGTASSVVSTHNTSTESHNDIRALITDLTTKLNNFLNVDDETTDQLSEVLTLIENNKGTLESLTTSKVNVSDIVDNLITNDASKVLSAAQGAAIQSLINTLQAELDAHTHTVSDITDLTATATELNYMDGVTSNVQAQLDSKLSLDGGTLTGNLEISKANSPKLELATNTNNGYTSIYQQGGLLSISSGMTEDSDIGCIELKKPDDDLTTLARLRTKIGGVYHDYKLYGEHNKPTANDVSGLVGKSGTGTGAEIFNDYANNTASGQYSHAEGSSTNKASSVTTSTNNDEIVAAWETSNFSLAKGTNSHVEGKDCLALGDYSHAEGYHTKSNKFGTHAEGSRTTASGMYSHVEGSYSTASGQASHAEGYDTTASGVYSHTEGQKTKASGLASHAENYYTIASGDFSHAEGYSTKASGKSQHVQGKYNIEDTSNTYIHIVGNGTSEAERSNAHTVDWDGNAWFQGDVYVGGESQDDTSASRVITEADHEWTLIYDSGEIPNIANSISGIDVSGYTNFEILVRCYNDGDSHTTRTGSAIFTAENGKTYQFPVWTNMFTKSISTASVMAQFKLIDGWLICPCASKLTGDIDIFDTTEGGTAGNLTPIGSGMMKCTSPLSTLTISNLDQNSDYYFGMGSRVMVWGGKI